jgi:hypothetical protein
MGEGEVARDLRSQPAHCREESGGFLGCHLDRASPSGPHCSPRPESWIFHHLMTFVIFTPVAKIKVITPV